MDTTVRYISPKILVMTLLLSGCASPRATQHAVDDALGLNYPIYATLKSIDIDAATEDWPAENVTSGLPISIFPLRGAEGQRFPTHYVAVEVTEQNDTSTASGVPPRVWVGRVKEEPRVDWSGPVHIEKDGRIEVVRDEQ